MAAGTPVLVHATAIAVDGRAALIRGPSGAGKSDLALRCIAHAPSSMLPHAALLIADDQVCLERQGSALIATPPAALAGLIEVRGLGVVPVRTCVERAVVNLIVELVSLETVERLPEPPPLADLAGVKLPVLRLWAFEASAPIKVLLALSGKEFPFQT